MAPSKRLNLSSSRSDEEDESSSSSSSSDAEQQPTRRNASHRASANDEEETEDESDEEFEIPPGFESVPGSGAVTREQVLSPGKELWFFKLPKHLDASALAGMTFKVGGKREHETPGAAVAHVTAGRDGKKYVLQHEHEMLAGQLVNALPLAADRSRFVLAKPFARCFSLVEDHAADADARTVAAQQPVLVDEHKSEKKKKKKKHRHESGEADEQAARKKSKKSSKSTHHDEPSRAKKHKA